MILLTDPVSYDSAAIVSDTKALLEMLRDRADARALPEIVRARDFLETEKGAFTVDSILRNFPPVEPFVVQWDWPRFHREEKLDPKRLKSAAGRPAKHSPETLLECLGDKRLTSTQWSKNCAGEHGVGRGTFFELLKDLQAAGKIAKSVIDGKWEQIRGESENSNHEKDQ